MARSNLLSCLEKRDLLNRSAVSVDKMLEWGVRFEEAGLLNDAVDFYEKAKAVDPLENLLKRVREEGDSFLYGRILKALGREASALEWISIGEKATQLGKHLLAGEAFRKGGREDTDTGKGGEQ